MATDYFTGSLAFVAVKTLIKDDEASAAEIAQALADFEQEIETMKELQHPHLVTLLGSCVEAEPFMMILEFSCGGSLEDWLPENGSVAPAWPSK